MKRLAITLLSGLIFIYRMICVIFLVVSPLMFFAKLDGAAFMVGREWWEIIARTAELCLNYVVCGLALDRLDAIESEMDDV